MLSAQTSKAPLRESNKSSFSGGNRKVSLSDGEHDCGLSRANGDRFRRMILSRGNTQDLAAMYLAWRGKAPSIDAMMKYRELAP